MPTLHELCDDLAAEHHELDSLVSTLDGAGDAAGWQTPTPAPGWTIRDQLAHLTFVEGRAALALGDSEGFAAALAEDRADAERFAARMGGSDVPPEGAATYEVWRATGARFLDLARASDPAARVPWYGPPMRPASMVSARIMETWAHAGDVADALGVARDATNRLRHIAHLGVGSRAWSYQVNELEPDPTLIRVELTAPDGSTWEWGDAEALEVVRGPALDFCLVVTRRRHVADTALTVVGAGASQWMQIAQAFAGPPGPPPLRRSRKRR